MERSFTRKKNNFVISLFQPPCNVYARKSRITRRYKERLKLVSTRSPCAYCRLISPSEFICFPPSEQQHVRSKRRSVTGTQHTSVRMRYTYHGRGRVGHRQITPPSSCDTMTMTTTEAPHAIEPHALLGLSFPGPNFRDTHRFRHTKTTRKYTYLL